MPQVSTMFHRTTAAVSTIYYSIRVTGTWYMFNPFKPAVQFRAHNTKFPSDSSAKRGCGTKRVEDGADYFSLSEDGSLTMYPKNIARFALVVYTVFVPYWLRRFSMLDVLL